MNAKLSIFPDGSYTRWKWRLETPRPSSHEGGPYGTADIARTAARTTAGVLGLKIISEEVLGDDLA